MLHELLSILLYIGTICSPCTYAFEQIEYEEQVHQHQVDMIRHDPYYLAHVVGEFGYLADEVTISNPPENY